MRQMTVKELICRLNEYPNDTKVVIKYDENGWYDLEFIELIQEEKLTKRSKSKFILNLGWYE